MIFVDRHTCLVRMILHQIDDANFLSNHDDLYSTVFLYRFSRIRLHHRRVYFFAVLYVNYKDGKVKTFFFG